MKVNLLFLSVLLLLASGASATTLPTYSYTDTDGRSVTLSYPQGSMTLLHFWATWCVPCVKELPTLDAAAKKLAAETGKQWRVIAVSLDDTTALVSAFYKRHRIENLSVNIDTNLSAMKVLKVGGLPTTLVIDDKGNEVKRFVGDYDWTTFDPATLTVAETKPLY